MMTTAETLVRRLHERPPAPDLVEEAVTYAVLDLLGCAAAGAATPGGRSARVAALAAFGAGAAGVWFSSDRLTPPGAAFVNSAYASMLDLDDGHRAAAGHPGAAVIPAVLSAASAAASDAGSILSAIAIGYEVGVRIGAARDFSRLRTTDSGLWCAYAAAAAVGWLRGLSPEKLAHAIAIAGTTGPGLAAAGRGSISSLVKEGIPSATAAGLIAVELASAGYTGPLDILDAPELYDSARILDGLGDGWRIQGVYFKLYSCCRWAHAAIDAGLELQARHGIDAREIETITVSTFPRALMLGNQPAPLSMEAAQYSVPFSLALALVRGPRALLPLRADALGDVETVALARRVQLAVHPDYADVFPARVPAQVTIATARGAFSARAETPAGDPGNPLSLERLRWKFGILSSASLSSDAARTLEGASLRLGVVGVGPTAAALSVASFSTGSDEHLYPDTVGSV